MIRRTCLLAVTTIAFLALAGAASAWTLALCDSVTVGPGNITVAELSRDEVPAEAGAVVIVPGGRPGFGCEVTRQTVLRRLVMAGLAQDVALAGARTCHVRVSGASVAHSELQDRIRQQALAYLPPAPDGAPASWLEITAPEVDFVTDGEWNVVWPRPATLAPGRQLVTMTMTSPYGQRHISVTLTAHVFGRTPQAVTNLSRGQTVVASQLAWTWTDLAQADRGVITDPRALENVRLQRDLVPGQSLRRTDLESIPLVRRGQMVDLIVQRGSVSAVLRAECRQDGHQGQMVSVMNPLTKRPLLACVSAPGVVTMGR